MFYNYKIKRMGNNEYLYLYLTYDYEFSKELLNSSDENKEEKLVTEVIKYIKEKKIKFKGNIIKIVIGGTILFTLILNNINEDFEIKNFVDKELISYTIPKKENEDKSSIINETKEIIIKEEKTNKPIQKETKKIEKPKANSIVTEVPKKKPIKKEDLIEEPIKDTIITLHRSNGTILKLTLEDYVIGVVCAEMPASFHIEALKAQAVASRTYALKRINENKKLTDSNYHQLYKDETQMKAFWGSGFNKYFTKIKNAVNSTKGEYIAYNNYYIDALFHSTNNGKTEDPIFVWGGSFPYLKSVDSHWDLKASTYYGEVNKTFEEASSLLGFEFNRDTNIQIVSKTVGNRVNEIIIDENNYTGNEIRDLFGLKSSDFDIEAGENSIKFSTRGYGHGVGMSQYGANGMAKEGFNYKQILNHYYPNTKLLNSIFG